MARMRTIKQTAEYIKDKDPETAATEWWIRLLAKSGKIKHHKAGSKYLIDIDALEEYLSNPPEQEVDAPELGKLRKVY